MQMADSELERIAGGACGDGSEATPNKPLADQSTL